MEDNAVTFTENVSEETTHVTVETEDASFEIGDAARENGIGTFENGDGTFKNGGVAFESEGVPNETGHVTEENGAVDAEVENSNVGQELPTEIGKENVEKRWPGWPGESVFRILIPAHKVGSLIGRKGELIKKMCDETKARIKVLDGPKGVPERAVIISAKEEPGASVPPAIDGLLRVHKRIIDGLDGDPSQLPAGTGNQGTTRLLVAAAQAGILIGKQGATIKSIQEDSGSAVRVVENLPPVALHDDRVVEITGEPNGVHKAVELVANHLRKFLVDRSVLPLFEKNMPMPDFHLEHNMPPQSWGTPHGLPLNAGGSGYGGNPQFMPSRPHDSYYPPHDFPPPGFPPHDFPPPENQSHHGLSMYGQNGPAGRVHTSANQQPSMVSQVTHHMQIPLTYADAVIGSAGANISYIRRASGATITIQESRITPGDMTVEISGTATQVQTAEQLIQNFMADAAPSATAPNTMSAANQSYSSYAEQGLPVYGSPPSNAAASAHVGSGYGSSYGSGYGY